MRSHPLFLAALLAASGAGLLTVVFSTGTRFSGPAERNLEIVETIRLEVPPGKRSIRLWIPRLPEGPFQSAELLEIESPWTHSLVADPDFGNRLLYLEAESPEAGTIEVRLRYRIRREEQTQPAEDGGNIPRIFTRARGLVVINEEVRGLARAAVRGLKDPMRKAKALYHYVLSRVDYDTTGEGWGRGDVIYACKVGKGNCTDFHSLFIALARAEGIPARFKIGYPLPEADAGPVVKPYHCWAEFHIAGKGWIPVDISEAWKHPSKADYYFGRLDADRILVSTGREIRLSPHHSGKPLNYLVRPYAEADGKPLHAVQIRRVYKNIKRGEKT